MGNTGCSVAQITLSLLKIYRKMSVKTLVQNRYLQYFKKYRRYLKIPGARRVL
jgi:hypothetical protein